jgi:endonuclease/exonuclease/phosphatase (EEP) superfamily protein YafD
LVTEKPFRIVQFNAWSNNKNVELDSRWIAGQRPDVVVLEEATPEMQREIIKATGLHTSVSSSFLIASREATRIHDLADHRSVFADISGPDGHPFRLFAIHRSWPTHAAWYAESGNLLEAMSAGPISRTVVLGDFNAAPWSYALGREEARLGLVRRDHALFSWPARLPWLSGVDVPLPLLPLDHAYAGLDWKTVSVSRGPRLGSDHYPLLVTLALRRDSRHADGCSPSARN